jgi:hypothetical protein
MDTYENISNNSELEEISWEIDEYTKHPRSKKWYIIVAIIALALIVYALLTKNYFFALIIIISSGLIVFYDNEPPKRVPFAISYDGVTINQKPYDFEDMRNFYIIYRPKEDIKKLFFEFKNPLKHRLVINLEKQDPVDVRNYLLQYLDEDLEKEHEPLSEGLAKIFRL